MTTHQRLQRLLAASARAVVMLLLSITPAEAQPLALGIPAGAPAEPAEAVRIERLNVTPPPEELPYAQKSRWQRFEEALDGGTRKRPRRTETRWNDVRRMSCHEPCLLLECCVRSGGGFLAAGAFGR